MNKRARIVGLIAATCIVALVGWGVFAKPAKPSVLITDAELLRKFNSEALPTNYHVLARTTSWKADAAKGRFERSWAATVMEMDNAPVDPKLVGDHFKAWLAKLVKVPQSAPAVNSPRVIGDVIYYTAAQTTGELRYTLKPVSGSTLTVNGNQTTGNIQELDIQIVEQLKR